MLPAIRAPGNMVRFDLLSIETGDESNLVPLDDRESLAVHAGSNETTDELIVQDFEALLGQLIATDVGAEFELVHGLGKGMDHVQDGLEKAPALLDLDEMSLVPGELLQDGDHGLHGALRAAAAIREL